jgi:inosose dehydratase
MSEFNRREFLATLGAAPLAGFRPGDSRLGDFRLKAEAAGSLVENGRSLEAASRIKLGYAAITWGGDDPKAIDDIATVGFKAIQLRASAFDRWGTRPGELRELLSKRGLTFAVLSSGNLGYQPEDAAAVLDFHLSHAKFVRDSGGQLLQVIDEKPANRPVTKDDYGRLADLLNTLGEKTKAIGVPLVYHHHMNSTGEAPDAIEAIMSAAAASSVGLLFDIAHYQQGGGDPVQAIRRYGKAIKVVHLKDVRPAAAAPGYQWVELGRGRVDVRGCVAALNAVNFSGWAIVELDRVVDTDGSPIASAHENRSFVVNQLGLTL